VDPSVDASLFDIDAFDNSAALVRRLHDAGKKVYCYVDAGSWERWRPDASTFPGQVLGNDYVGWPGERWLDVRRIDLLAPIMLARMRLCARKGFDGVQFDNIEGVGQRDRVPPHVVRRSALRDLAREPCAPAWPGRRDRERARARADARPLHRLADL
jgi:endo-alpha-1,4-polygalactosaminidase (GH114 family)